MPCQREGEAVMQDSMSSKAGGCPLEAGPSAGPGLQLLGGLESEYESPTCPLGTRCATTSCVPVPSSGPWRSPRTAVVSFSQGHTQSQPLPSPWNSVTDPPIQSHTTDHCWRLTAPLHP